MLKNWLYLEIIIKVKSKNRKRKKIMPSRKDIQWFNIIFKIVEFIIHLIKGQKNDDKNNQTEKRDSPGFITFGSKVKNGTESQEEM